MQAKKRQIHEIPITYEIPMVTKTRERVPGLLPRDKALRASDTKFRMLASTTESAMFTCWGERLLLRMADRELRRMKNRGGKTISTEETDKYVSIR
jgi:hypothetical protein